MGKLYAISDVHVSYKFNYEAFTKFLSSLPSQGFTGATGTVEEITLDDLTLNDLSPEYSHDFTEDGLILAGDISEKVEHLRVCFELAAQKFKTVWWVPGNHELYTLPKPRNSSGFVAGSEVKKTLGVEDYELRGEAKYKECCRIASELGVLTPEDEFVRWEYSIPRATAEISHSNSTRTDSVLVCPVFTLYDYSFRPAHVSREQALEWALEENIQATDEILLHPDPYSTRDEWCEALITKAEERLQTAQDHELPLVIINHWPLREDLITIPQIPRFTLWCGTKRTKDWHTRFNAKVVVTGHLHVRRTDWRDGCRFEEVSLGYPRQWEAIRTMGRGVGDVLREILPSNHDERDAAESTGTIWRGKG